MCGIFGFVLPRGDSFARDSFEAAVGRLFQLSEPRGKEASGLLVGVGHHVGVLKRPLRPSQFLSSADYRRFMADATGRMGQPGHLELTAPVVAIGHCRLVTNGAEVLPANNQPVVAGRTLGVHNGIVANEESLAAAHPTLQRQGKLDSEMLFGLIDRYAAEGASLPAAIGRVFDELCGTASIACLHDGHRLALATNVGSLYVDHDERAGRLVFTSERYSLEQYVRQPPLPVAGDVRQLQPGTGLLVDVRAGSHFAFDLKGGG